MQDFGLDRQGAVVLAIGWLAAHVTTLRPEVAMDRVRAAISQADPLRGDAPQPAR